MEIDGVVLIDKPEGPTSHDIVSFVRRITGMRRAGHAGTLDPMASGLLPVLLGRCCRAFDYFTGWEKRYIAEMQTGIETDTEDLTGRVTASSGLRPSLGEVSQAAAEFKGRIEQIPPMYSALKVNGQKLYDAARAGMTVERAPREICVHSIEVAGADEDNGVFTLDIRCGKGTYIRTICAEIGKRLGCGAAMKSLRRLSCGGFDIESALTPEAFASALASEGSDSRAVVPPDIAFERLPGIELDEESYRRIANGVKTDIGDISRGDMLYDMRDNGYARLMLPGGRLAAICCFDADGGIKIIMRFDAGK